MVKLNLQCEVYSLKDTLRSIKYDLTKNVLKFNYLVPSLKNLSIVRIIVTFFKQIDIHNCYKEIFEEKPILYEVYLSFFVRKARDQVDCLSVPLICKGDLIQMIDIFENELLNFFSHISILEFRSREEINDCLLQIHWTPQGVIDRLKTLTGIIENTNFSILKKYRLACEFCMEVKIRNLFKRLPASVGNHITRRGCPLVAYWTFKMKRKLVQFFDLMHEDEPFSYLMEWALCNKNEAAVQYIWENLADDTMSARLICYAKLVHTDMDDMLLYLCSQMNQNQLEETCIIMGQRILKALFHYSKYHDEFIPSAKYVLSLTSKMSADKAVNLIIYCWHNNVLNLEEYKNIWIKFANDFELGLDANFIVVYKTLMNFHSLCLKYDLQTAKFLLSYGSYEAKKELVYDDDTMLLCANLIAGNMDLLDIFLKDVLKSDDEIKEFKYRLIESKGILVCSNLIVDDNYELLDQILIKFCGEKRAKSYKTELPFRDEASVICSILRKRERYTAKPNHLILINNFLIWCFKGNSKEIIKYKAVIFDPENRFYRSAKLEFYMCISNIVRYRKWSLMKEYIQYIFSTIEIRLTTLEKRFSCMKAIYVDVVRNVAKREFGNTFKRFLTACFTREEILELKTHLEGSRELFMTVRDLILGEKFTAANEILEWCYASDEAKIYEFRQYLMKTKGFILISDIRKYDLDMQKVEGIFNWANPNVVLANSFLKV